MPQIRSRVLSVDGIAAVPLVPLQVECIGARVIIDAYEQQDKIRQTSPEIAIIATGVQRFGVSVAPLQREAVFPAGVPVHVTIHARTADLQYAVILDSVDLSGLGERPALKGLAEGEEWRLTSLLEGVVPHQGTAGKAQALSRAQVGLTAIGSVHVVIAVDGSASMVRCVGPAGVAAAVEVLSGVASTFAGRNVNIVHVGLTSRLSESNGEGEESPGAWVASLMGGDFVIGVDMSPENVLKGITSRADSLVVFVLSDTGPLLGDEIPQGWHWVVFGSPGDESPLPPAHAGVLTTITEESPGYLEREFEKESSPVLKSFVASLVSGAFAALNLTGGVQP